jgi:hypothetical protein
MACLKLRASLRGQYHAGIAMLRQSVERCPESVWTAGGHPRSYWRIAFHATFYTHLYLMQNEASFRRWEKDREHCAALWGSPPILEPYTRLEIIEYIDLVDALVDTTVDELDLETEDTGFHWYPSINKLDHQLMNLRHLQGHVGQLSELLMEHGVDVDWVAIAPR